jgi:hypothetical protein
LLVVYANLFAALRALVVVSTEYTGVIYDKSAATEQSWNTAFFIELEFKVKIIDIIFTF